MTVGEAYQVGAAITRLQAAPDLTMDRVAAFRLAAWRAQHLPVFREVEAEMDKLRLLYGEDAVALAGAAEKVMAEPFAAAMPSIPLSAMPEKIEPGLMAALLPVIADEGA